MSIEIISCSISTKVWDQAGIKFKSAGSAIGLATYCATGPGSGINVYRQYGLYEYFPIFTNQVGIYTIAIKLSIF